MAEHKVTFMENTYTNEKTGEKAPGVTVILNGGFGEMIEQIRKDNPKYENNIMVVRDALFFGLNAIIQNGGQLPGAEAENTADAG
ncbi:MAG: hypothetical protein J5722_06075 [Oscillospiraceae bacterium]|nr:hypothetical protein [Oscillospiraceae bacterium]